LQVLLLLFLFVSKLVTLKLAGNELLSFPNDRIDVLASLLHLDVSRNHIDHLPINLPYLYRLKQVIIIIIIIIIIIGTTMFMVLSS